MSLNFLEWDCPSCGKHNREDTNTWCYGTPIRHCRHCDGEYLDRRWREVAVEGFDPRSTNSSLYLKGCIGFALFAAIMALWIFWSIRTKGYYMTLNAFCVGLGVLASIACFVLWIRIRTGAESKNQAPYMEESMQRMQDPAYVQKLISYGYQVPDTFRK